jgi:geranylgeranyl diphosphate synthase type II
MSDRDLQQVTPPEVLLDVIREIAVAAGFFGMVGGQVVDLQSEGQPADPDTLQYIHTHKTGAMIIASVRAGALLSGAGKEDLDALTLYGRHIGLAFQIADDILNVEGDRKMMGKGTGSDAERGKLTYPALMGLEASRARAAELVTDALAAIRAFDDRALPLRMIASYITERNT